MREPVSRWRWSGLALVLASISGAVATSLWWLPCRGAMLVGTPFGPSAPVVPTDACLDRMGEGTPFPLPTPAALSTPGLLALATATIALVAVAWLLPVLAESLSVGRRAVAALPGLGTLGVGMLAVGIAYEVPGAETPAYGLASLISLLVLPAVGVLWGHVTAQLRYLVAALALSTMGFAGPVVEYLLMVHWSELDWDAPPGSGYLTAVVLFGCGVALLAAPSRRPSPRSDPPLGAGRGPADSLSDQPRPRRSRSSR